MNTTTKFFAGIVLVVAVAVGGYYAWQSNAGKSGLANISATTKLSDSQVSELLARIGAFLVVPSDEKPSVAVINDAAQLAAQQAFYKDAKNGDVLVVYSNRAIIYDPKSDKLVNVGPIVRNDASPSPVASGSADFTPSPSVSATPSVTPKAITIDVRNGTTSAGLAGATASTLKKNKLFLIGVLGDAKGSYKATVVVDFTKDAAKSAAVAELAKQLGVTAVTKLPAGEEASTADALVIVGK